MKFHIQLGIKKCVFSSVLVFKLKVCLVLEAPNAPPHDKLADTVHLICSQSKEQTQHYQTTTCHLLMRSPYTTAVRTLCMHFDTLYYCVCTIPVQTFMCALVSNWHKPVFHELTNRYQIAYNCMVTRHAFSAFWNFTK